MIYIFIHFYGIQFDLIKVLNSLTYNDDKSATNLKFRVYAW